MAPQFFFFNPTCEMAVANGQVSYQPPAHLRVFERELALLPLWLAGEDDWLWHPGLVDEAYAAYLRQVGAPKVQWATEHKLPKDTLVAARPWGWSPAAIRWLRALGLEPAPHPLLPWQSDHRDLLSRYTGRELALRMKELLQGEALLAIPEVPRVLQRPEELEVLEATMTQPWLLKAPWSASGRGLFKIRSRSEGTARNPWVLGKLRQQGALLAEPFLDKVQDLSFHFVLDAQGVHFSGTTFFETDKDGQFLGCYVGQRPTEKWGAFPMEEVLFAAAGLLQEALSGMDLHLHYHGFAGVDALLFRDEAGALRLHPCIELNLRSTMGRLNLALEQRLHPQSSGFWRIERREAQEAEQEWALNPPVLKEGHWFGGTFPLTPAPVGAGFQAVLRLEFKG